MPTALNEADEIRRQMAHIRHDLHQDVRDVVATAEKVADWTRYLGMYPWVSLGVAFGVGYYVVPKRRTSRILAAEQATLNEVSKLQDALKNTKRSVSAAVTSEPAKKEEKAGLVGAAFGMLAPMALRAAQSYALKYLESWIAQQAAFQPAVPPAPTGRPQGPSGFRPVR